MAGTAAVAKLPSGTVTFFFSDVEGSTRLAQSHADRFAELMEAHHRLCRAAIGEAGGTVVRTEGDAFFGVFTEAGSAVEAAVAIQRAHHDQHWPEGAEIRVRIGLHTGIGHLGGDDYIGLEVHRAARIGAVGHGGQIIVSDTTRALVANSLPDGISLRDLGEHHLKDLETPERLGQLVIEGLRNDFPPIRTRDAIPNNLPKQLTSFVERVETAEVADLVAKQRLVTLTGPGGTGKTRLALEVAAQVADQFAGVYFVPLAPVVEPDLVAPTILSELDVLPSTADPVEQLQAHLGDRNWLLVLDNFEQVVEAAGLVSDLLTSATRLSIMVTSRAALRLQGEHEFPVPPLELPDETEALDALHANPSVRLFLDRAQAVNPAFELTEANRAAVVDIINRLDGLPLAIELAAARSKLLDPQTMSQRLTAALDLAAGTRREVSDRQQTLRGAIKWSYDLLEPTTQAVLLAFSVFRGGATFDAIDAVCASMETDMLGELSKLMDHSLIRRADTPTGPRLLMLETIREFAAEQLTPERLQAVKDRHLTFFLQMAEDLASGLTTDAQGETLDRLAADRVNLSKALEWALETSQSDTASRMVHALWRFWHMRGPVSEGRSLTERVLAMEEASPLERYQVLEAAGGLAYWQVDFAAAESFYAESVALAEDLEDDARLTNALYNLSFPQQFQGDYDTADRVLERALELAESNEDPAMAAKILWAQGTTAYAAKQWSRARPHFERALKELAALDDPFMRGWAHRMLGATLLEIGETEPARAHLEAGLAIFGPAGDLSGISLHLLDFAHLAEIEGQTERAAILVGAALGQEQEGGTGLVLSGPNVPTRLREALEQMAEEDFERLTGRGRRMAVEEAIGYAQERDTSAEP